MGDVLANPSSFLLRHVLPFALSFRHAGHKAPALAPTTGSSPEADAWPLAGSCRNGRRLIRFSQHACKKDLTVAFSRRRTGNRTYFIYRHVCDGGELGCSSRRIATTHRLYVRSDRQRNAPRSRRPFGLRPGRSSPALPSLTISTYGLRRAPRIRSVLATTHHAPIYEIGSSHESPR